MKRIIVIGDIFNVPASAVPIILNENDAIEEIVSLKPLDDDVELIIEQGVDLQALTRAVHYRENSLGSGVPKFHINARPEMPRAGRRLAHKAKRENICVSYPRQVSDKTFELDLQFSAQNEFFLDHMTGFHIQGMALSEAARQAFLVVTEEFFLSQAPDNYYFVIRHQNVSFENFVFPFGVTISYEITEHKVKSGRQSFVVKMDLVQGGVVCSRVDVAFTVFSADKISEREEALINERIHDIVSVQSSEPKVEPVLGVA